MTKERFRICCVRFLVIPIWLLFLIAIYEVLSIQITINKNFMPVMILDAPLFLQGKYCTSIKKVFSVPCFTPVLCFASTEGSPSPIGKNILDKIEADFTIYDANNERIYESSLYFNSHYKLGINSNFPCMYLLLQHIPRGNNLFILNVKKSIPEFNKNYRLIMYPDFDMLLLKRNILLLFSLLLFLGLLAYHIATILQHGEESAPGTAAAD